MTETDRRGEVLRVLHRYLVEVVERYDLCPWARAAREGGEVAIEVLWGAPPVAAWVAAGERLLAAPSTRVAMVVAPESVATPPELRAVRDQVTARIPTAGVADFHPAAALDLASPARLVPYVRRSPDPLLQLVPLTILNAVRGAPPIAERAVQAQLLGGLPVRPPRDVVAQIAAANHATVHAAQAEIQAVLDDIAQDRDASYARAGISVSRRP